MFIVTGPGSPSVLSNMVLSIEQHVEWITACIGYADSRGYSRVEATAEAEKAWGEHVIEVAYSTLFPMADSWYVGANIPGKPRVFTPYIAGVGSYRERCDAVASAGYEGFVLTVSLAEVSEVSGERFCRSAGAAGSRRAGRRRGAAHLGADTR
jgi:cyclohexanone monooxygenase